MGSYITDSRNIVFQRTKKYPIIGYYKYNIFNRDSQWWILKTEQ